MQREVEGISVIGLGKLGAPLAAVMASKGFSVLGVDLNEKFVAQLNAGKAPVQEPGLQQLIDASRECLRGTTDISEAILHSDLTFIIVPTPSNEQGVFANKHVLSAVVSVGEALRAKPGYHVVNITSTVMPGSTAGELRDALERSSGRRVGRDVGLCYNPEFIALGTVIHDMLWPDAILIGESDTRAGDALERVYRRVCGDRNSDRSDEPHQRRADQNRGQHLRHHQDFLCQHASRSLRAASWRGCGCRHTSTRPRQPHRQQIPERRYRVWRPLLSPGQRGVQRIGAPPRRARRSCRSDRPDQQLSSRSPCEARD